MNKGASTRRAKYADTITLTDNDNYSIAQIPTALWKPYQTDKWRRQVWRYERQPKSGLSLPMLNGRNNPIAIMCVVDALMRIDDPNLYIVSSAFSDLMNVKYPHVRWDAVTCGRILSELAATAEDLKGPEHIQPPIYQTWWNGKRVYGLNPSILGHYWWGELREFLGDKSEQFIQTFRETGEAPLNPTIWAEIEDYDTLEVPDRLKTGPQLQLVGSS